MLPQTSQRWPASPCDKQGEVLHVLKERIAALEAHGSRGPAQSNVPLGIAPVDAILGGGVMRGAVHEIASASAGYDAAATGFSLAIAALAARSPARREVLWIQHEFAALECGALYGPGVALHAAGTNSMGTNASAKGPRAGLRRGSGAQISGFGLRHLIVLRLKHMRDVLWAMEEGLKSPAVAIAIADMCDGGSTADATATRRLALAAADAGTTALLLRAKPSTLGSTAATRWEVASAPGLRDRHGGLGRPAFALTLTKNRRGPPGRWLVTWDHHERAFALPVSVAAASGDRQARAVARAS